MFPFFLFSFLLFILINIYECVCKYSYNNNFFIDMFKYRIWTKKFLLIWFMIWEWFHKIDFIKSILNTICSEIEE